MSKTLTLKVNERYRDLFHRPSQTEYQALKSSIELDGQRMPIVANSKGIILDGYTRYKICGILNLTPKVIIKDFKDEIDEEKFVISCNLNRRHLNTFQKAEVCYHIFETETERAKLRVRNHNEVTAEGRVYDIFGKQLGVGHTLTHMIVYIIKNGNSKLKQQIREDTLSIRAGYDKIKGINKDIPSRKKSYPSYSNCLVCNGDTTTPQKRGCHAHSVVCCTSCKWGR